MRIERIREELGKARRRAAEWQAKAKDLERQLTEQENMEIIQAVRSVTASPEELGEILGWIRAAKQRPGTPEGRAAQPGAGTPQGPQNEMTGKEEKGQDEA